MLAHTSLQSLGAMVEDSDTSAEGLKSFNAAAAEVARRCENDNDKVKCLLDHHVALFKNNSCAKHWNEVIAMMAGIQFLNGVTH
jgi:hypothetical protein